MPVPRFISASLGDFLVRITPANNKAADERIA